MGVDKFGRYAGEEGKAVRGPKGDGFDLTASGDFDVKNKRMCNVADPVDTGDSVNLNTLTKTIEPCLRLNKKRSYDAMNAVISNVGIPTENGDAVTMGYVQAKFPKQLHDSYSVHQFRIQDLAYPITDADATNVKYVKDTCVLFDNTIINGKNLRMTNLKDPIKPSDAVTLRHMVTNVPTLSSQETLWEEVTELKTRVVKLEYSLSQFRNKSERQLRKFALQFALKLANPRSGSADGSDGIDWDFVFEDDGVYNGETNTDKTV